MALALLDRLAALRKRWGGQRFDRRHGMETSVTLDRDELTKMSPELRRFAGAYIPTSPALFKRIVRKSKVDPKDFAFVDLGCGKGRILVEAAYYPFRAIMGVEADAGLCQTAIENLKRWRQGRSPDQARVHRQVEVMHSDARTALLPAGNLFIFMYSPFRGHVFATVAERLAALADEPGRAVVIAYSADFEALVLEQTGRFTRVRMRPQRFWTKPTVSFFYNDEAMRLRR
jgi:SAM-dependent methyltransferase